MTEIYHINCVRIVSPLHDNVCGHCLLIKENNKLILIDTGIGYLDTQHPVERIGQQLIDMVGYRFNENITAIRQIENLGLDPKQVTDCVISHMDNDHIGGIADFPQAAVHVGAEEFDSFNSGNPRYLKLPMAHQPAIKTYAEKTDEWYGFEARRIDIDTKAEIYLIPLFGHTAGHCGVAVKAKDQWIFYIADAYYLRAELDDDSHPVNELARMRAENNDLRIENISRIRKLIDEHPEIEVFGYHDIEEFRHYNSKTIH
ncbi:MBL fold metallo-hydrolase [Elizabethkingia anophelis]|uniref:MBL fold hydrolase n=1 Tax=Elizabethkingia anophelis TaxID=1117645 RepID=A0A1T3D7J4_9FLAO|nr:MBL fold metallo-hydrolase [Elizabethkingia anophelis]AQW98495.1 MBL fold hydrolase [Elizabethkingia anophelis]AQX50749.1 MBL fold metallo-hydrolase [Elizabethkingia anophelis]AQX89056.1 MBL fold metallo-hydrolase [Elizabethkingia anophelis]ASV78351.1 MBL fold metallo-hydrolase [Elizabethkingia anophelis]EHM7983107.1 MBL fold metallo-hydrolase [Elizabethkingia anophelis]